jgi:hypothetical protein
MLGTLLSRALGAWGGAGLALLLVGCSSDGRPPAIDSFGSGNGEAGAAGDAGTAGSAGSATQLPPLQVLFLGNSYTAVNDLPAMVAAIASSSGNNPVITVSSQSPGGYTLHNHWDNEAPIALAQGGWTQVVLQEQSVNAFGDPTDFQTYAALLADAAKAIGATPVFYETWARAATSPEYAQWTLVSNPTEMQDALLGAYQQAATTNQAHLAPVGEAWRLALAGSPTLQLHDADGSHPTVAGTYLAACVLYETLAGQEVPLASAAPTILSASAVKLLRQYAHEAVATY